MTKAADLSVDLNPDILQHAYLCLSCRLLELLRRLQSCLHILLQSDVGTMA